jgi:archaellum component FlaC
MLLMETIKSKVVSTMDQESINQIREIVKEETQKIVREEIADTITEFKETVLNLKLSLRNLDNYIIRLNTDVIRLNTDVLELKKDVNGFKSLVEKSEKLDKLQKNFNNHTHEIIIETGETEVKTV